MKRVKKVDVSVIGGRLKPLGYTRYAEYLDSAHWRDLRKRYAESDLPHTCVCGAMATALHHKTYARLGHELLSDLQPLCDDCHQGAHHRGNRKKNKKGRRRKRYSPVQCSSCRVYFVDPATLRADKEGDHSLPRRF